VTRVIATKKSTHVGACIYCGSTDGELTEEHITPYGLGGRLTLLEASCERCRKVTGELERIVLRDMLYAARAALGTPTRRKNERLSPRPMAVERSGQVEEISAVWQDHRKVIQLPIFPVPACIDQRAYVRGIEQTSMDVFDLGEKHEELAARLGVDRVLAPECRPEHFARFIAKMALGYGVERYGLAAFEDIYVRSAILGDSDDIGRWVGCSDRRELPVRKESAISVGFRIIPGDDLVVKIKMFTQFDGAEYVGVVGKVKEIYRNWIHSQGERG
jgi:HNH endonuclease